MGRNQAVATTLGIRWRGFPAWFLARTYHLALMPGNARRVRLMADWTVGLLFGRDSAELGQLGHPPALPGAEAGAGLEPGGEERVGGAGVRLDDGAGLHARRIRFGGTARSTRTGAPSLPSQIRSSGKRIVNVWTERQRGICSA